MNKELQAKLDRGREYYKNREYEKAEPFLRAVLQEENGYADVANMLGIIYHDQGQVALAQELFEKALRINPRYTEAALNLAVAYNEQGLYAEARQIHEHISSLARDKDSKIEPYARGKLSNMHADLGYAYAELQIFEKAIEQLREALDLNPKFVDVRTRLGQILRDAGQIDEAIAEFEKVKKDKPHFIASRISLGAAFFANNEKESAQKEWKEVLNLDPQNRTAGMYLRMVEQLIAQDEASEAGLNLEVDSNSPPSPVMDLGKNDKGEDLQFSFDGETSNVAPLPTDEAQKE